MDEKTQEPQSRNMVRQTAFKVKVSDLLNGKYAVQEGWEPNYIPIQGRKVSRANIIGVVVSKQSSELGQSEIVVIDDGSGRISVRSFEGVSFSRIKIGDVVILVGRPREYGGEIYIVPEIIRELEDKKWVDVRKVELELGRKRVVEMEKEDNKNIDVKEEIVHDVSSETKTGAFEKKPAEEIGPAEKIIECISNIDRGGGADFEEVIKEYNEENAEEIINSMLKRGDIFELKPGKLKILK